MASKHECSDALPYTGDGPAVTACYEDDLGQFWATNEEYESQVNFCPMCGERAPKAIEGADEYGQSLPW